MNAATMAAILGARGSVHDPLRFMQKEAEHEESFRAAHVLAQRVRALETELAEALVERDAARKALTLFAQHLVEQKVPFVMDALARGRAERGSIPDPLPPGYEHPPEGSASESDWIYFSGRSGKWGLGFGTRSVGDVRYWGRPKKS